MHKTAQAGSQSASGRRFRLALRRFSAIELLIALVLLLVVTPFIEGMRGGEFMDAILVTIVLLSAVMAVGGRLRMLLVTMLLAVPPLLGKWINHVRPDLLSPSLFLYGGLFFLAFIIVNVLRFVLRAKRVTSEVLCASISVYLLFGLVWALAYRLVAYNSPGAFAYNAEHLTDQPMAGFHAFYFSFVTLTTVGYGDITPVSNVARMLAVTEAMTGLLYVAVLIARLVAVYSAAEPPDKDDSQ